MAFLNLSGQTLGQYELRELLGSGGMGAVYRAYQVSLQRAIAVKVLPTSLSQQPGYLERFNREAKIAAALEHPHIVPILDHGTQDGVSYVVMRLLTGGTLSQRIVHRLETDDPLPSLGEVALLLKYLGSALDYAHSQGVIHRDIKPTNVMFDNHGNAYLVDFGIAKLLESTSELTDTGMTMGTPSFMSPEQWKAEAVTARTDQYAMGVLAYSMVTGRMPFEANTPYALMHKHLNEMPTPPQAWRRDFPEEAALVIERAMAKRPEDRFESVTAFALTFEAAIRGIEGGQTGFFARFEPPKADVPHVAPAAPTPYRPVTFPTALPDSPTVAGAPEPETLSIRGKRASKWRAGRMMLLELFVCMLLIVAGFVIYNSVSNDDETPAEDEIAFSPSETASETFTLEPSVTYTVTSTDTPTATDTAASTATNTATKTETSTPSNTPTPTLSDAEKLQLTIDALVPTATPTLEQVALLELTLDSINATLTATYAPSPTFTPTSTPSLTFTPRPTRTPSPTVDPVLQESFEVANGVTAYDETLWRQRGGTRDCIFSYQDGVLMFDTQSQHGAVACELALNSPRRTYKFDELGIFEARLMLDNNLSGSQVRGNHMLHIQDANNSQWVAACGFNPNAEFLAAIAENDYANGVIKNIPANVGQWYTFRLEVNPVTSVITCYVDGQSLGMWVPPTTAGTYDIFISDWRSENTTVTAYADDVYVAPYTFPDTSIRDDFDAVTPNDGFNPVLWEPAPHVNMPEDCQFTQQSGSLVFSNTLNTEQGLNCELFWREPSTTFADFSEITSFQADFKFDSSHQGSTSLGLTIKRSFDPSAGVEHMSWSMDCILSASPGSITMSSVADYSGTLVRGESEPASYDRWYTFRYTLDAETRTITCYVNDVALNTWILPPEIPTDNLYFTINTWHNPNTNGAAYVDNVVVQRSIQN